VTRRSSRNGRSSSPRQEERKKDQGTGAGLRAVADAAVDALDEAGAAALLLAILHNDMQVIVERYISAQRQQVVAAFENWWDKYRVTLDRDRGQAGCGGAC
jgi:type I restriction enzyme M protein